MRKNKGKVIQMKQSIIDAKELKNKLSLYFKISSYNIIHAALLFIWKNRKDFSIKEHEFNYKRNEVYNNLLDELINKYNKE